MSAPRETSVPVPERDLQHLLDELDRVVEVLDEVGRQRVQISMLRQRVALMMKSDPDATPVRPPSHSALAAFKATDRFSRNPR